MRDQPTEPDASDTAPDAMPAATTPTGDPADSLPADSLPAEEPVDADDADPEPTDSERLDSEPVSTEESKAGPGPGEALWAWAQRPLQRRIGLMLLRITVAVVGAALGVLLGARTTAEIGPFTTDVSLVIAGGGAEVNIPPLGSLSVDAFDGPLSLEINLARVDEARATALVRDPAALDGLGDVIVSDLRGVIVDLLVRSAVFAIIGAAILAALTFRRTREALVAVGMSMVLLATTAVIALSTWRPQALEEPTYTGLLTRAPALIGNVEDLVTRFTDYRKSLEKLVGNLATLYSAVSALPVDETDDTIRMLHVSDLHLNPTAFDLIEQVIKQFKVEGVLDTGDITDWGSEPESSFVKRIATLGVPYVFIRGNHDSVATAQSVASQPNAVVLDKSTVTIAGLEIVGIGDPRFTPDKTTRVEDNPAAVEDSGEQLAEYIQTLKEEPDIAMVHDPAAAEPLDGEVPLVLAGHKHKESVLTLSEDTTVLVEGSTGGAGLRGLEGEEPTPLQASVLYFDSKTKELRAYDTITLGGLGETEVTIQRHVIGIDEAADGTSTPTPTGSGTPTSGTVPPAGGAVPGGTPPATSAPPGG